jgi:O-antigen/teichoic acid export membrane protein
MIFMPTAKRIVKNTAYLSSAFVGQKILSFIYFTLIARLVGVVDTGGYVFALSFTTIFSVFVDFGLAPLIQREIARHPDKTEKIIGKTLAIKSIYAIGAIVIAIVVGQFMGLEGSIKNMIYIALALMVFDSFNLTLWSAFRGHHKLQFEAFAVVASQIITLVIGLSGLLMGANIEILILALLMGSIFTSILATFFLARKLHIFPIPRYDEAFDKKMISESIPFGFAGAFTRVFSAIDSVLLKVMVGPAAVGFYAVPNKIVFALQFIPSAFAASIYPAMSHLYKSDKKKMILVFEQSLLFLILLSVPLAIGIFVLTPFVITELYTQEFAASIPAMYILVWGVIFGFIEFPLGSLLSAIGQQKKNTITRGVVMTLNVVLNIILIPLYSFNGAAIAAVISYALLTAMGIFWVNKFVAVDWKTLVRSFAQIAFSAIVMGLFVYFLLPYLHFTLLILLGVVIYAFLVIWMRVITIDQIRDLFKTFKKESS